MRIKGWIPFSYKKLAMGILSIQNRSTINSLTAENCKKYCEKGAKSMSLHI